MLPFDTVIVAMDQPEGTKIIPVFGVFPEGTELTDAYSGVKGRVSQGRVSIVSPAGLVLLSR
jgi:alpha-amylase